MHCDDPAFDELVEAECDWHAFAAAAVEHLSVDGPAGVVSGDDAARSRVDAVVFAFAYHFVIDAFGEECVLEMEIKFVREGDVMEVDEVIDILKDIGKEV